ncbi:TRPM8 channel-associated factor 3-like [Palaemon carinicauda]|uniref:TRPM8 channel-associated factor 3-like n=1 Tax=Palaemon carinicauda TaxID=392227 RepID=UPI0035B58401
MSEVTEINGKADEADFLISQSALTSLTVLKGSGPSDTKIGLANCSGKTEQQWFHDGDNLLWGGNPSYCLIPKYKNNSVTLGDPASSLGWNHDKKSRFVPKRGYEAMDVPWVEPRIVVELYPLDDEETEKWWTFTELKAVLDGALPAKYPVSVTDETTYIQEMARTICNWFAPPDAPLPYKRDVETFPGLVSLDAPRITRNLVLDLSVLGQSRDFRMIITKDWQATNLYIPPDEMVEVILPQSLTSERAAQIQVRVSAHTDRLEPSSYNVIEDGEFFRMPLISETFDLAPGTTKIRSQFGGHLIFTFSDGESFLVYIKVRNMVEAPYFRLGETTKEQWAQELKKGAPYTLLESDQVVVLVATSDAQNIADPDKLMNRYNEIIDMLNYSAGFDETEVPPRGKFWLVDDKQITNGGAHNGFPAMFDSTYFNLGSEETPYDWVSWHELGHNYQQSEYWADAYGIESTVNLYSLYIQRQLFDEDRLEIQGDYNRAADHIDAGMTFAEADVWEQLVFLMEIKWAFPHKDWEMFRQLRKITRALSKEDAEVLTSKKQNQYDHVYKNLSKIVGSDLINTYNRWSLKISQEAQDEIAALGLPKAPGDLSHRTNKDVFVCGHPALKKFRAKQYSFLQRTSKNNIPI